MNLVLPRNSILYNTLESRMTTEEAENALRNGSHLFALIGDFASSVTLDLDVLQKSIHYKQGLKKAVNLMKKERSRINKQFCIMGGGEVTEYVDEACEKFEAYIRPHIERLKMAFCLNYHRNHVDEAMLLSTLDTCGVVIAACLELGEIAASEISRRSGHCIRPAINLSTLLKRIEDIADLFPGHIHMEEAKRSVEVENGVRVIFAKFSQIDRVLSFYQKD